MKEKVTFKEEQTKALEGFRRSLEDDGKSPRTVESYIGDVEKFFCHLNANGHKSIAEIERVDATKFFSKLVHNGFKPATVNARVVFGPGLRHSQKLPKGDSTRGLSLAGVIR